MSESKFALDEKVLCLATFALKKDGKRLGRTVFTHQLLDNIRPRAKRCLGIVQPFSLSEVLIPALEICENGLRDRVRIYGILNNEGADTVIAAARIGVAPT